MDEDEIRSLLKHEKRFKGVFAIDEIAAVILDKDTGIIVNTSERSKAYGHWLLLYKTAQSTFIYIDSLNLNLFLYNNNYLKMFFKKNNVNSIKSLCYPIQPLYSKTCALYVIYFLCHLLSHVDLTVIISHFDCKNLFNNDALVSNYILKKLK